jgi:hypothetical protein
MYTGTIVDIMYEHAAVLIKMRDGRHAIAKFWDFGRPSLNGHRDPWVDKTRGFIDWMDWEPINEEVVFRATPILEWDGFLRAHACLFSRELENKRNGRACCRLHESDIVEFMMPDEMHRGYDRMPKDPFPIAHGLSKIAPDENDEDVLSKMFLAGILSPACR